MEKVTPTKEVINVNATSKNAVMIYSTIKELWKDTQMNLKKLAHPLSELIKAHNVMEIGLKKRDVQLTQREDIMDKWVTRNRIFPEDMCA